MIQLTGVETVSQKLSRLSEVSQQRLLDKTANVLLTSAKKRIDSQVDVSGSTFKERKDSTDKRKMLLGLKDRLVVSVHDNQAVISFTDSGTGSIAYKQQFGSTQTFKASTQSNVTKANQPATIRQATELIDLGFRIGNKLPMVKTITQKYTIAQAGFLIRKLRAWRGIETKTSWTITLPARSFLGVTDDDLKEIKQLIFDEINQ